MSDVFFSYNSQDRARILPFHRAVTSRDIEVFWDLEIPLGKDWDSWIKAELKKAKIVIVFWTPASLASSSVRQEAAIAGQDGKLIQVGLTPLTPETFPMGLYTHQAIDLQEWTSDEDDSQFQKLIREIESKLIPKWVTAKVAFLEGQIESEIKRRQLAETRENSVKKQLELEIEVVNAVKRERDSLSASADRDRAEIDDARKNLEQLQQKNAEVLRAFGESQLQNREFKDKVSGQPARPQRRFYAIALVAVIAAYFVGLSSQVSFRQIASYVRDDRVKQAVVSPLQLSPPSSKSEAPRAILVELKPSEADSKKSDGVVLKSSRPVVAPEASDPLANDCDRLAANPSDASSKWPPGVGFWSISGGAAERACRTALVANPTTARFIYQLGRSLHRQDKYTEALELYEKARALGYAAANEGLAVLYDNGLGVSSDSGKAAQYRRDKEKGDALVKR